jgi:UDP-2,3-diacylglucosamine hydrolase
LKHEILFISDLHLALEKRALTRHFLHFLQHRAHQARALYILGDLFDTWVGDDDNSRLNQTIKRQFKQLTDSGTEIFMIAGNRDFLLGERFCRETGINLLTDYAVLALDGQRVLLCHGDLLCTDDTAYQAFRERSHTQKWQANVLSKPLWLRRAAARWYRLRSYWHKRKKTQDIMDVNQHAVQRAMREHQCQTLIHGHTHRAACHAFMLDGQQAQRLVLSEWRPKQSAEILSWTPQNGFTSEHF